MAGLSACGANVFPIDYDARLGLQAVSQIESDSRQFPLVDSTQHPVAYQELRHMVNTLLASGQVKNRDKFVWRVRIIKDDKTLNAFCLPGGYIYVYTGLIKYLKSGDELAGVLGHEIAHADLRHSTQQMTKQFGLGILVSVVTGGDPNLLSQIGSQLVTLGFSRTAETEADRKAVDYLYATRYDARGVARFFEKLIADEKDGKVPSFLSTHPNPDNRVRTIMEYWQKKGSKDGEKDEKSYLRLKANLP